MTPDVNQPSKTSEELEDLTDNILDDIEFMASTTCLKKAKLKRLIESEVTAGRIDEVNRSASFQMNRGRTAQPEEMFKYTVDRLAQLKGGQDHE